MADAIHTAGGTHTVAQPVAVYEEGTLVGTRKRLNFVGSAITAADNTTEERVDVTVTVTHDDADTHTGAQPVAVEQQGSAVATRGTLNFVGALAADETTKVTITVGITTAVVKTYPAATSAPVTLSSTNSAYSAGAAYVEIVPASTITNIFYITHVALGNISNVASQYILRLATGGAGAESVIADIPVMAGGANASDGTILTLPFAIKVAANTRVAGKLITSGSTIRTGDCRIVYLETPL